MIVQRVRAAVAAAAVSVLVLAGCAVPGQDAAPGVAGIYNGVTVTEEDMVPYLAADDRLRNNLNDAPARVLHFLLMGDEVIAAARERGFTYDDTIGETDALFWISVKNPTIPGSYPDRNGVDVEVETRADYVIPEMIEFIEYVRAVQFLVFGAEDGFAVLEQISTDFAAGAVIAPRYGEASSDYYAASIGSAIREANDRADELGPGAFTVFGKVLAIAPTSIAQPDWLAPAPTE